MENLTKSDLKWIRDTIEKVANTPMCDDRKQSVLNNVVRFIDDETKNCTTNEQSFQDMFKKEYEFSSYKKVGKLIDTAFSIVHLKDCVIMPKDEHDNLFTILNETHTEYNNVKRQNETLKGMYDEMKNAMD